MTIAGIQPQIWISVIAIIGVAALALLVDYLRGKNQQLREALVELRLRRVHDQKQGTLDRMQAAVELTEHRTQPPAAPQRPAPTDEQKAFVAAAAKAAAARIAAENGAATQPAASTSYEQPAQAPAAPDALPQVAAREAQDRGMEVASTHGRRRTPPPANLPRLEDMNPREALAEWLNKRAATRAATKPAPAAPVAIPEPAAAVAAVEAAPVVDPAPMVEPSPVAEIKPAAEIAIEVPAPVVTAAPVMEAAIEAPAPPAVVKETAPSTGSSSVVIDESLWESLLGASPAKKSIRIPDWTTMPEAPVAVPAATTQVRLQVIQGMNGIPAGMQERSTWTRLLDADKAFTGLAVCISVSQTTGGAVSRDTMLSVYHFVRGLLREGDFGCQTGDEEFMILCPEERGADAQRRLTEISEQLWDFQLRSAGNYSVLFSWGDAQVEGEPLSEAAASATERMQQTRRTRKTVSLDSASPRKKVAAAI